LYCFPIFTSSSFLLLFLHFSPFFFTSFPSFFPPCLFCSVSSPSKLRVQSLKGVKVKLSLYEGVWGSGCIHPHFIDIGTSWRWLVSFTPRPLHPRERATGTHCIGGWVDPRAGLDDMEQRKFLTLPGLELRPLGRPARCHKKRPYQYWTSLNYKLKQKGGEQKRKDIDAMRFDYSPRLRRMNRLIY
jgi:hypothetical protein